MGYLGVFIRIFIFATLPAALQACDLASVKTSVSSSILTSTVSNGSVPAPVGGGGGLPISSGPTPHPTATATPNPAPSTAPTATPTPTSAPAPTAAPTASPANKFSNTGLNFNWQDRRPIGELMLAPVSGNGAIRDGFITNPRGWLNDKTINVNTPLGLIDYQNKILAWADQSISVLNSINAQGMITWDLEGEEYPQDTTYIGDPTMAETLAPEWDSVISNSSSAYNGMKLIDAYFKKFRDAGLKIGITLRPQTLEVNNSTDCNLTNDLNHTCQPFSNDQAAQAQNLIRKIEFAKQRWGASIFYVDSNVTADQYWNCYPNLCNNDWTQCPATCPDGNNLKLSNNRSRMGSISLDASTFTTVMNAEPSVLVIPEHHSDHTDTTHGDYFKTSSPLYQLFQDFGSNPAHTPDDEIAAVPGAFSSIIINNAGLTTSDPRYQQLITGVKRGDLLITRAWWQEPDLDLVRGIYNSAFPAGSTNSVAPGNLKSNIASKVLKLTK